MIICVVPAAGISKRFPWNKLLFRYHDKPLVVQVLENIVNSEAVDSIVLVTGYMKLEIEEAVREAGLKVEFVWNPNYEVGGMSSSIRAGVSFARSKYASIEAVMVNPADAAWIHPGVYALVVSKYSDYSGYYKVAVAAYRGRRGHPILFSGDLIEELLTISEEKQGLKEVVNKYRYSTLVVETEYPGVLLDLDTILDVLRVKATIYK